jgi:hypothetical protein
MIDLSEISMLTNMFDFRTNYYDPHNRPYQPFQDVHLNQTLSQPPPPP